MGQQKAVAEPLRPQLSKKTKNVTSNRDETHNRSYERTTITES